MPEQDGRRRWIVRDRVLGLRNGNGVWAGSRSRIGALVLREKIYRSRYRGSMAWTWWRRVEHYKVPKRGSLIVVAAGGSDA